MMKKRLLFVDDEPNVLNGIRRMLRDLRSEWHMEFVSCGPEALARMAAEPFDVVISDIRMPGMDGIALLTQIADRWPETVRIILSGHTDRETVVKSVGFAHQFLSKPCDAATLRSAVVRACSLRQQLSSASLRKLVSLLQTLPSLPIVYRNILEELQSADASAQRIGELVSRDVAMTAKILQLVNSSFVGLRDHVTSPIHASVLLGTETMKALALSVKVFSLFGGNEQTIDTISRHSMRVARFAKRIAEVESADEIIQDQAFMAGLLHDVGKLVLLGNFRSYADLMSGTQSDEEALSAAELAAFGATQSQIGGYLLGLWGLPDTIVEAVTYQACPGTGAAPVFSPLTAVHAAHVLEADVKAESSAASLDRGYLIQLDVLSRFDDWRAACEAILVDCQVGA